MSRTVKDMIAEELRERYSGVSGACVVDLAGLDVQEQQQLRIRVREKAGRLEVIKNSMAKRAFQDCVLKPLGDTLDGPCALVTSSESLIDVAKVLVEAAKEFETLGLKQAILEGDPDLLTVADLARMKSRLELIAETAMLISSPGRALAGCLGAPQSKIAGCLKTLADKAA